MQAKAGLAKTISERVEIEKQLLDNEREQRLADLAQNRDLTAEQRAAQRKSIDVLYGVISEVDAQGNIIAEGRPSLIAQRINREEEAQLAQEAATITELQNRNAITALDTEYELATSIADRARIAAQIVDTETKAALAAVDIQLANEDISKAKRAELDLIRKGIVLQGEANKRGAANGNLSPSQQYKKDLEGLNFGDQLEDIGINQLRGFSDELSKVIVQGGDLGDVLGNAFKQITQRVIALAFELLVIKPLLESLSGTGGGGGSGLGGLLSSLFGGPKAASGTSNAIGGRTLVGERGPEFVNLPRGAQVIPNSLINSRAAATGQSGGVSVIRLELSGDIQAQMTDIATGVSIEVTRTASQPLIQAAVNETFRRGQRPSIGR